jgi:hypothetical protein
LIRTNLSSLAGGWYFGRTGGSNSRSTFRDANLEAEIATKTDLRELEYRLIIKLGAMIVVAISIVATLVKLL